MKLIITILVLFICCGCSVYSQKKDTSYCLMLVCDTEFGKAKTDFVNAIEDKDAKASYYLHEMNVHWQYGYAIFELFDGEISSIGYTEDEYKKMSFEGDNDKTYLDANKKQLSKNIIVWQSIPVK